MKKYYFYLLATAMLAGCTSDELLNEVSNSNSKETEPQAISFGSSAPNLTRGTSVGSDAASKLHNSFVVYGTKHIAAAENETADNDAVVYNMYHVSYTANSAYSTETNTSNWEYVGDTAYSAAVIGEQTIKYWDLSAANGYTFYAFASNQISYPANDADVVKVEKITSGTDLYKKGFKVTLASGANMADIYYADRVTVAKAAYGDPVTFTFRGMGSKVRVGFYETIPGYSVKINKFYYDDDAASDVTTFAAMNKVDSAKFQAAVQNIGVAAGSTNTMYVEYYDNSDPAVENRAIVKGSTVQYQYNLQLGGGILNTTLGTSSSACTWDDNGSYTSVYPNVGNANPMLIRCDYTLTSTDGSNETIEVKNARVVVPVQYVQWKSNYAYTYIFKISDKTNGTTGAAPTDPDDPTSGEKEGLYPITFDAVVIATDFDNLEQETITALADNSVTTYQNGKVVTANNEYRAGAIYVVNTDNAAHTLIAPSAIGEDATMAQIYKVTTTGDGISEATVYAALNGAKNGLTLTAATATLTDAVPAADGSNYNFGTNGAVSFAADSASYAYVYCKTKYVATTYKAAADDYSVSETYYLKTTNDVYYRASGIGADNYATYKSQLYVQDAAGTPGVYDIKVIRVE